MSSYNLHNPKPPKWATNVELATSKLWSIDAGGCTCGRAIAICNAITANGNLPVSLRLKASARRTDLIAGRSRMKKPLATNNVITLKRAAQ